MWGWPKSWPCFSYRMGLPKFWLYGFTLSTPFVGSQLCWNPSLLMKIPVWLVKIPPSITYVNFHVCQRNYAKIPVGWWKSQFNWLKSDLLPFKNSISVSETRCYTKSRLSVAKWIPSWWLAHLSGFKSSFHFRVVSHGFLLVKTSFPWICSETRSAVESLKSMSLWYQRRRPPAMAIGKAPVFGREGVHKNPGKNRVRGFRGRWLDFLGMIKWCFNQEKWWIAWIHQNWNIMLISWFKMSQSGQKGSWPRSI